MTFSDNVTVLEREGRTFYIVGTAHISQRSVEEVRDVIERVRPDTVCVELCRTRHDTLMDATRWRRLDIFQIIRQKKVLFLLANLALSAYQRRLGDELGVRPGAELMAAVEKAREIGADLVLADRDIQATLKRTWRNLSFGSKLKVLGALFEVFFTREELTEEALEKLKDRDHITEVMKAFAQEVPQVKGPLIDERDLYLASSIFEAPGRTVVAVVGAGHVEGIVAHFGEPVDRAALSVIPPPARWTGALKWIIPALILAAFYVGYTKHEGERFDEMLYAWILPNAVAAGFFGLLAGARVLSVLTAIVASPITSLNPTIGAGMVVGLLEAWLRRPTVEDCERVPDDMTSLRGLYRNRFTRVLLVAAMVTLGSALGAWIGAGWVTKIFIETA